MKNYEESGKNSEVSFASFASSVPKSQAYWTTFPMITIQLRLARKIATSQPASCPNAADTPAKLDSEGSSSLPLRGPWNTGGQFQHRILQSTWRRHHLSSHKNHQLVIYYIAIEWQVKGTTKLEAGRVTKKNQSLRSWFIGTWLEYQFST